MTEEGEQGDVGEDDDDVEGLDDLWDSFAERWEKAFQRLSEAEDAQLKHISEQVQKLSVLKAEACGADIQARIAGGDAKAQHNSQVVGAVIEAEHAHAAKEVFFSAEADRQEAYSSALKSSDDMVRDVEERMAQRRREAEAKRREAKQKRDAEAEARRRSREQASAGPSSSGPPPASGSSHQQQRRSSSNGPRLAPAGSNDAAPKSRNFASFAEYNAAWTTFEQLLRDRGGSSDKPWLRPAEIPWPNGLPRVSGIAAEDSAQVRKKKLRAAMLRWHPDKWANVLAAVLEASRAEVIAKVQEVTRKILDEKRMLG